MADIKYSIWLTDRKEMLTPEDSYDLSFNRNGLVSIFVSKFDQHFLQSEFEARRFTGLKDKNGKEIYESDIVKYGGGAQEPTIEQVVWMPEQVAFTTISEHMVDFDGEKWIANGVSFPMNGEILEVIGDIYSTPELIKGVSYVSN